MAIIRKEKLSKMMKLMMEWIWVGIVELDLKMMDIMMIDHCYIWGFSWWKLNDIR